MHKTGGPCWDNQEGSGLPRSLQRRVVCESNLMREAKPWHHGLLPCFKTRSFCWPVLIRSNTCLAPDPGSSVSLSTTAWRARSSCPVHRREFGMLFPSNQSVSQELGQGEGMELGEKFLPQLYPHPWGEPSPDPGSLSLPASSLSCFPRRCCGHVSITPGWL